MIYSFFFSLFIFEKKKEREIKERGTTQWQTTNPKSHLDEINLLHFLGFEQKKRVS